MTASHRIETLDATGMLGATGSLPASAMKTRADKPPVAPLSTVATLSPAAPSQSVAPLPARLALRGPSRPRDRRGVLLLVVLSILVLFVVIAVTFVLIAGQFRRGARPEMIVERYTNDPQRQLDDAVYQIFRGTDNVQSVVGPHSLLEDMYGTTSVSGYLSTTKAPTTTLADGSNGQFIDLHVIASTTLSQYNGYYNGQVLTMLNGPARGLSTRIIGYTFSGGTAATTTFRVMAFEGLSTTTFIAGYNANVEQRFVVNGRAFNGTGFGFNPNHLAASTLGLLDATDQNGNYFALLPNPKYFVGNSTVSNQNYTAVGGIGGADEDYDAPDPQNMALAWMPINPAASGSLNQIIFPSFHRPDLVNWYVNASSTNWNDSTKGPELQRQVILRPLPTATDHPLFTGSNPNFSLAGAITGPWDVDNDGDGIPDSIWIDLGYPVQTAPDGKTYKPLFAFLVLDMDGRLNVNAHGNLAQTATVNDTVDGTTNPLYTTNVQGPFAEAGSSAPLQNSVALPRGQSYGPAEINLGFGCTATVGNGLLTNLTYYQQLLTGYYSGASYTPATDYDGRYGELNLAKGGTAVLPGQSSAAGSADDVLSQIKHFEIPQNYFASPTSTPTAGISYPNLNMLTSYGSPPDLWGRGAVGLDYRGQPFYTFSPSYTAGSGPSELPNSPYSLNLSQRAVRMSGTDAPATTYNGYVDNAYTPAELERLLRRFDVDSYTLPDRLRAIIDPTNSNTLLRQLLTTDSYDVPSPSPLATTEIRNYLANPSGGGAAPNYALALNATIVDMVVAKLQSNGVTGAAAINTALLKMLPPELMAGQYMDINRPFGNGRDDSSPPNYVVDEPQEYYNNYEQAWSGLYPNSTSAVAFDLINSVDVNADGTTNQYQSFTASGLTYPAGKNQYQNPQLYARQLYARHLYVLMVTLMDSGYITSTSNLWGGAANWGATATAETAFTSTPPNPTAAAQAAQQEITTRRIAQWAINVADYRDTDSIMTPFEYDVNPFNGWDVDGIVDTVDSSTDRRVVWGCEYPDLMISETFAMHDRRVRDTKNDTGPMKPRYDTTQTPPAEADATLDQIRVPQGSLFVELYCPRPNSPGIVAAGSNPTLPNTGGSQAVLPGDLYTYNAANNQWNLDLGRMSPAIPGGNSYPVWRLAVLSSNLQTPTTNPNNVMQRMETYPVSTSLDPPGDLHNGSIFNAANVYNPGSYTASATIERIAWFAANAPSNPTGAGTKTFYNQGVASGAQVLLQPGGYAVVGPRQVTTFGRVTNAGYAPNPAAAMSPQAILLMYPNATYTPNGTNILTLNNSAPSMQYIAGIGNAGTVASNTTVGTNIQQPLSIICAGGMPKNVTAGVWTNPNTCPTPNGGSGIGISVSEPLFSSQYYYTMPTQQDAGSNGVSLNGSLIDAYGSDSGALPFLDQPFETMSHNTTAQLTTITASISQVPLLYDSIPATGTYLNYKTVLLQRLANPLLPYNPMPGDTSNSGDPNEPPHSSTMPVNPYITVDWMPINLTVFNGDQLPTSVAPPALTTAIAAPATSNLQSTDPDDYNYDSAPTTLPIVSGALGFGPTIGYGTAQRGITTNADLNIWGPYEDTFPTSSQTITNTTTYVFGFNLTGTAGSNNGETLGYLNRAFLGTNGTGHPWSSGDSPAAPVTYVGDPSPAQWMSGLNRTFPWLNWANRPFVSHYELAQVPASSPSRLLWEFGYQAQAGVTPNTNNAYDGTQTPTQQAIVLTPFKHLLNFMMTAPQASGSAGAAPHFYRLFEYVRAPSRFVATDTVLNPTTTAATSPFTSLPTDAVNEQAMFSYYHPPFNKVSKYRDPGKVNANTIAHPSTDTNPIIWSAVQDNPPVGGGGGGGTQPQSLYGPSWQEMATSRQGPWIMPSANTNPTTTGNYPSMFGNPFRSFAGADFGLPVTMSGSSYMPPSATATTEMRGIDVTFMRFDPTTNTAMLFDFPPPAAGATATFQAYNAPDRNSYFRYQNMQAMGNLLTTRSNVYAVWVTVGYFQVQPWTGSGSNTPKNSPIDNVHPDGYQLADELGSDTGDIVRHRAFYMFDRTIPVAFERGLNHNVDRAILLRRYIE